MCHHAGVRQGEPLCVPTLPMAVPNPNRRVTGHLPIAAFLGTSPETGQELGRRPLRQLQGVKERTPRGWVRDESCDVGQAADKLIAFVKIAGRFRICLR